MSDEICYYVPHHGVLREDSSTTKLRVVFDASAPLSSGIALNDLEMVGPTVKENLLSIILRFRKHQIAFTDMAKIYRQVLIHPSERFLQRILWRREPSHAVETYSLNTVTYGTAPRHS